MSHASPPGVIGMRGARAGLASRPQGARRAADNAIMAEAHRSNSALELFWDHLRAHGPNGRRTYPRIHARVPVHIIETPSGTVGVVSVDVSRRGMQFRCDRATAVRLCPQSGIAHSKPTYPVTLDLKVGDHTLRINAHGRIAHLTLVPDAPATEAVAIGVEFLGFQDQGERVLQRFVEQHLRPVGT